MLAQVKKALDNPNEFLRDPNDKNSKKNMDNMRRVNKKLAKKKEIIDEKRRERNKMRNVQCLGCKKCKFTIDFLFAPFLFI